MLRTFAILLFLAVSNVLLSQESKIQTAVTTGVSIPLGKYSGKSLDDGSFALAGWNISLDGSWTFFKGLGAGIQAGYYVHPIDVESLAAERVRSNPFLQELVIRSDPYRVITLAGFVQHSFKIAQQLTLTPRAGAGAALGFSPYQLSKPVYFLVSANWAEKTSTWDWSPYFMGGGNLYYRPNECLSLSLGSEVGYTKLTYSFRTGDGTIKDEVHRFLVINVLAGFSIYF